jgi:hypothetical protein
MQHAIIPPHEPERSERDPIHPPIIYIEKQLKWEYKQVVRNLESEKPLDEKELNTPGEDGWELTGIAQQLPLTDFYFKRQIEI